MPILTLKNGTTLVLTTITPDQLTELEDFLINTQITVTDLQYLASQVTDFNTQEKILLIVDRYTQFTSENDANKVCLFALYVQEIIKNKKYGINSPPDRIENYLSEQIDNILQMEIESQNYNMIKGYYFIFLNKIENASFLLEKSNGQISEIGTKIIMTMKGKRPRGNRDIDALCNWYLNKKERNSEGDNKVIDLFPKIKKVVNDESSLDGLITSLADEKDIVTLKNYLKIDSESFISDLNYLIGKLLHLKKDYLGAIDFYKKSTHPSSIYNLMRVTRTITDNNSIYRKIHNYIYLTTNQSDKIVVYNDEMGIYYAKKNEKWCGSAVTAYFNLLDSDEISRNIVVNNISFFYMKCVKNNEIHAIEKLLTNLNSKYGNIRRTLDSDIYQNQHKLDLLSEVKKNIVLFDDEAYNGPNASLFYTINLHLANLLCQFSDSISLYNLSFFLKSQSALLVLKCIKSPDTNTLIRLSIISDSMDYVNDLVLKNELAAICYIGFYHLRHKNIKHSKESFKSLLQKTTLDYSLYAYLSLSYICFKQLTQNRMFLEQGIEYLRKALIRFKNSYLVMYNIGVFLYAGGEYDKAMSVFKNIARDERNSEKFINMCKDGIKRIEKMNCKRFK